MALAKKHLGQHWLTDESALDAMAHALQLEPEDAVLEIGPGQGVLTERLLERGARVWAVEYDSELLPGLKKRFTRYGDQLTLVQGDILSFDLSILPRGYKVVANIPYYLTSNLLRMLCEAPNHFASAALLMQKEVAERVVASPGDMSILSVSVQLYCDAQLGLVVPASAFDPTPKVDSQILLLEHIGRPRFDVDTKQFFRLVKAGFSERRKMLRSSLSGGLGITKDEAESLLRRAQIDPQLRAQALSLEDWHRLSKEVH